MDKRGFEMSFGWMFAIIVGAMILFLAIYAVVRVVDSGQTEINTKTAKELTNLFEPFSTEMESVIKGEIKFGVETRVYNECLLEGAFGENEISTSQKSGFIKTWPDASIPITTKKYIFSESMIQGKKILPRSMPFYMPFKIDDLIIIVNDEDYCFVNPPETVQDFLKSAKISSVIVDSKSKCFEKKSICFSNSNCDITVYGTCIDCEDSLESGFVMKNSKRLYYREDLMYAAIFSSTNNYECNFARLMKKASMLAQLYLETGKIAARSGCSSNIDTELAAYNNIAKNAKTTEDLPGLLVLAKSIKEANDASNCKLFKS